MCRISRSSGELVRTAGSLGRALERSQQKPVPFYGTVVEDAVDLAAVDRVWCGGVPASAGAGPVKREAAPAMGVEPEPPGDQPGAASLAVDAVPSAAVTPMPLPADTAVRARPGRSPEPAARPGRDAGATPAWTTTRLDQGPGWTLEVVRPRAGGAADAGAVPGSVG